MKRKYYIQDAWQTNSDGKPFYYASYSTDKGNWTDAPIHATTFDTEQEALWKVEQLIKQENGEYKIIVTYS